MEPQSHIDFHYYTQDHLGNIREVVAEDGTLEQVTDYYPFGTPYSDNTGRNPSFQPYKFGAKELDLTHGYISYDFGARSYNSLLCTWDRIDPLCEKYYDMSPYAYCGDNPINANDPDGRKILFVNGYWASGWIGNLIGSDQCGKGYWGAGFAKAAQSFFKDWTPINSTNYIDGASLFGGDMSGQDRFDAGYFFAKQHLDELTSNMSPDEAFNMVTHSEQHPSWTMPAKARCGSRAS